MRIFKHILARYREFVRPLSTDTDKRRQEYILNLLLSFMLALAVLASLVSSIHYFSNGIIHNDSSFSVTLTFLLVIIGLIALSKTNHQTVATYGFIILLTVVSSQLLVQWGFMLPEVILLFALLIIVSGVLLNARVEIFFALAIGMVFLMISYAQLHYGLNVDTSWRYEPFYFGDAIGIAAGLAAIAGVSWLSNREIDASLQRARRSEAELAAERDGLEIKVRERTQELEAEHLLRILELRRFAEFGHFSANLLHEVANPLTAASINLERFDEQHHSKLVSQARKNLQHLERYIKSARNQLKGHGEITRFKPAYELDQVLKIMVPYAKQNDITIEARTNENITLYGDSIKFSQIMSNLVSNAIEAYAGTDRPLHSKQITIVFKKMSDGVVITVQDWGSGISGSTLLKIFDPLFTTKADNGRNMGIGLAMVKQFVENDFQGSIAVTSSARKGTCFELRLNGLAS